MADIVDWESLVGKVQTKHISTWYDFAFLLATNSCLPSLFSLLFVVMMNDDK